MRYSILTPYLQVKYTMGNNTQTVHAALVPPPKLTFRGHRPGSMDYDEPPPNLEFDQLEELLEMDWVKGFSRREDFSGYAMSIGDHPLQYAHLMATYKDGTEWWVVGYLSEACSKLALPEWKQNTPGFIPNKD